MEKLLFCKICSEQILIIYKEHWPVKHILHNQQLPTHKIWLIKSCWIFSWCSCAICSAMRQKQGKEDRGAQFEMNGYKRKNQLVHIWRQCQKRQPGCVVWRCFICQTQPCTHKTQIWWWCAGRVTMGIQYGQNNYFYCCLIFVGFSCFSCHQYCPGQKGVPELSLLSGHS